MRKESDLTHLLSIREGREEVSRKEWTDTLKEEGFANDAVFDATIKKLEADLKKARKKEADGEDMENVGVFASRCVKFAHLVCRMSLHRSH